MTCKECVRYEQCSAEVNGLDTEAIDCRAYKRKGETKTPKETTPEDVMRALECCSDCNCPECHYVPKGDCHKGTMGCSEELLKDTLALLREKDAEIERLRAACEEAVQCFIRLDTLYKIQCKRLETARSETITEFAERFKNALNNVSRWQMHGVEGEYFIIGKSLVDRIEKELKEEKK